MKKRRMVM